MRVMHGLSQRELAKRAGVTNGTISLIEHNHMNPSVAALQKVLDGFPMSLADFFNAHPHTFYRRNQLAGSGDCAVPSHHGQVSIHLVAADRPDRAMTITHTRYLPGANISAGDCSERGEEGGVVISGSIELTIGGETRQLGPGDAFYFSRSVPHRFRNPGTEPCEIVSASTPAFA
jgi:mannose-6-phosphate isomerase-like protein (cupin superfamily)